MMATGDPARMLGLSPRRAVVDLASTLKRGKELAELPLDSVIVTHASGVHVIPCLLNPRHGRALAPELLKRLFATLKGKYEYIIVDGGKGLTDSLIAAFDEAHLILLVTTPDIISLYQTKWAMNIIESLLFPPHMVKAVLNRAESRGGVGSEDVRLAVPCDIIGEIPSDGRAVGAAVNQGEPIFSAYGMTKVAGAFRDLARTLLEQPGLFVSHQEMPRHQQQGDGAPGQPSGLATGVSAWDPAHNAHAHAARDADAQDEIVRIKRRIHERLVEELNLKKVDMALINNADHLQEMRERCERLIASILAQELGGVISSHEVRARLVKEISDEALGLGPLEELLSDETITDILVNNKDQIYVERRGKLELTPKKFISNDQVRAIIERIVAPLGRRIDESNPMVDARLPDGSRVNAIIPPLSVKGPMLSIRKFARTRYTQEDLVKFGTLTHEMGQFITACVLGRKNLIVSGGTGSGKTTVLNVVSAAIQDGERIIQVMESATIMKEVEHQIEKLFGGDILGVAMLREK